MSERNAIKARTCTECDVNHTMVSNAFGLKKHAREVRQKRNAESSKVESPEKVLRDSPEESPGGDPTARGPNDERAAYARSASGGKDEGDRTPATQEVS